MQLKPMPCQSTWFELHRYMLKQIVGDILVNVLLLTIHKLSKIKKVATYRKCDKLQWVYKLYLCDLS